MLRRATLLAFAFCGALALACCGRSPTAPATPPARSGTAVLRGPSPILEAATIDEDQLAGQGENNQEAGRRGRGKYSLIVF